MGGNGSLGVSLTYPVTPFTGVPEQERKINDDQNEA